MVPLRKTRTRLPDGECFWVAQHDKCLLQTSSPPTFSYPLRDRSSLSTYSGEIPKSLGHFLARVLKDDRTWIWIQLPFFSFLHFLFFLFFSNTKSNSWTLFSSEYHFQQSLFSDSISFWLLVHLVLVPKVPVLPFSLVESALRTKALFSLPWFYYHLINISNRKAQKNTTLSSFPFEP